jgi:hypothetical protein
VRELKAAKQTINNKTAVGGGADGGDAMAD